VQLNTAHDRAGTGPVAPAARAFPGIPASVPEARAFVRAQFAEQDEATVFAVVMCTSELFTNAIAYTASRLPGREVLVMACLGQTWATVHVVNIGEIPPCLRMRGGLGMGLEIVGALASVFGVDGRDWWFTVPAGGAR
jgi:anti-sigma regulatory factor (Ser/Thr protein kinase)